MVPWQRRKFSCIFASFEDKRFYLQLLVCVLLTQQVEVLQFKEKKNVATATEGGEGSGSVMWQLEEVERGVEV